MAVVDAVVVVDASVICDVVAPDVPLSASAADKLSGSAARGTALVCPGLLLHEARNMLLTGIRRRRWDGAAADRAASLMPRLPLTIIDDERDSVRAWELARQYDNQPIYDMVYVALAERLGAPLVTVDEELRRRLAHLGWVVSPSELA